MKIYTKRGDDGTTSLYGGRRVPKFAPRIEVFGTVDELNALLGVALASGPSDETRTILLTLQQQLFVLGADVATPPETDARIDRISQMHTEELEAIIDRLSEQLPPLRQFILPGGSRAGSTLHLARTVCRRAERLLVDVHEKEAFNRALLSYLNRLSDLLFVLARYENREHNEPETPWVPNRKNSDS